MEYITIVASVPGVIAVVNFLKQLGLAGKAALIAAVVVGVALNVANYYLAASGAYQAGVTGVIVGLAAAGIYDLSATKA